MSERENYRRIWGSHPPIRLSAPATPAKISVKDWISQRLDNYYRIAATRSGKDRDGWLEDAGYFHAVLTALARLERLERQDEASPSNGMTQNPPPEDNISLEPANRKLMGENL